MLRVGVDVIETARVHRLVEAHGSRIDRFLRPEERGWSVGLDTAALFAVKEAVVKAVGGLSLFDATTFAVSRVRRGLAAIPRARKFEQQLIAQKISWVAIHAGLCAEVAWALAIGVPRSTPEYDAVVSLRRLEDLPQAAGLLGERTQQELRLKPRPDLSAAARLTAVDAAETLFAAQVPRAEILTRDDQSLYFQEPPLLREAAVSISHVHGVLAGAVARAADQRRARARLFGESCELLA